MTLDEALKRREESLRAGHIDTEAIEAIDKHIDGSDPRHPYHAVYMLGKKAAERRNEIFLKALDEELAK